MKYLFSICIITITLLSCKKDKPNENIKEDVEINLSFSLYDCDCGGTDAPTVEVVGGNTYTYNIDDIPNEIKTQTDWQNKEYIATLEIKDETCECVLGVDPIPGNDPPKDFLKKVEIIEITEK